MGPRSPSRDHKPKAVLPGAGASFVVEGYIYPPGTFDQHGQGSGVDANGDPEFPDLVLGTWRCRGWFIGDGMETATGPFVVTNQLFDFDPDNPGQQTLVSEGIELIDLGVPFERALTGGTGPFSKARGQMTQEAIGANASGLFNFQMELHVR